MAGSVKEAAGVAEARRDVDAAERQLASGGKGVTMEGLHRLRDRWRHAELSAEGAQARAAEERRKARTDGLLEIGAAVQEHAASDPARLLAVAFEEVAAACARLRVLADAHDATVAGLVAAALELGAEPLAPGGARESSSGVAVDRDSIVSRGVRLCPVRGQVEEAVHAAVAGDVQRAVASVRPVREQRAQDRPDHLCRGRGGALVPVFGDLSSMQWAQVRSGDLVLLDYDIDRYMGGELA